MHAAVLSRGFLAQPGRRHRQRIDETGNLRSQCKRRRSQCPMAIQPSPVQSLVPVLEADGVGGRGDRRERAPAIRARLSAAGAAHDVSGHS
jgi:hypothetical protein